jgi:hypothetical protein
MKDIDCLDKSLKLSWIKRLMSNNRASWKNLVFHQFWILKYLKDFFFLCNLHVKDFSKEYYSKLNTFWKQVISYWCETNYNEPLAYTDIVNQTLWLNSHIKVKHCTVLCKWWHEAGCKYVLDIIDDNGGILDYGSFCIKYEMDVNYVKYRGLVDAIPKVWLRLIHNRTTVREKIRIPIHKDITGWKVPI